MATLQKIRDNAGKLVTVIIALALFAFIAGDLFSSNGIFGDARKANVGEINGNTIPVQYFQNLVDANTENYKRNRQTTAVDAATIEQIQDQTWEQLVRMYVIEEEYAKLGMQVSAAELFDMVQGENVDPSVRQIPIFTNQDGQFDRNLVIQFLKSKDLDPSGEAAASWAEFEKQLMQNRLDQKYAVAVSKGLFVTALQAENELVAKNKKYNVDYVQMRYTSLADSVAKYTNSDLKAYYNSHKDDYKQEESRDILYVSFPMIASEEDVVMSMKKMADLKKEFAATEAVEQFVNLESDVRFNGQYLTKQQLPAAIDSVFDAKDGEVFGPVNDNGTIFMARKIESAKVADSVKARHILIQPTATLSKEAAKAKADSILAVVKKGGNFAELAKKFSADQGSVEEGGDLGWFEEGVMVQPFNDACFKGKKGDKVIAETQYGYHVIEIVDQTAAKAKAKVAIIESRITASSKTVDGIYAQASKFGINSNSVENFRANANAEMLLARAAQIRQNDRRLANFENPRQIIRWAYKAKVGEISEIFDMEEQYVVAIVTGIHKEGVATFEEVQDLVVREVISAKKAEILSKQLNEAKQGATTLQSVADKMGTTLKSATAANFSSFSMPSIGVEPKVQAEMTQMDAQQISEPIAGNLGVYLIQVSSVEDADINVATVAQERSNIARTNMQRITYQLFQAVSDASDVEDNRSLFY